MDLKGRFSWIVFLATTVFATAANIGVSAAQSAPPGPTVTGYEAATTMVQDPPGSPWQSVPTSSLPVPAAVVQYRQDQWVEIMDQGRPIRVSIMDAQVSNPPAPPHVVVCDGQGQPPDNSDGSAAIGDCTK